MSSKVPNWWNQELHNDVLRMADESYPNEFVGLFLGDKNDNSKVLVKSLTLDTVRSTPDAFFVSPQAVIHTAYVIDESGSQLLGTVHSHPRAGRRSFSDEDQGLRWWGSWHLLCVSRSDGENWDFIWGTSTKRSRMDNRE